MREIAGTVERVEVLGQDTPDQGTQQIRTDRPEVRFPHHDDWRGDVFRHLVVWRRSAAAFTSLACLVTALVTAGPAAAANSLSSSATPYQNSTISSALTSDPSGVRIAPAVVEWGNGDVVMTVPATATGNVSALPSAETSAGPVSAGPLLLASTAATVTPDGSTSTCPGWTIFGQAAYSCVYNATNWNGTRLQFRDQNIFQDLRKYGGYSWTTLSFVNNLSDRSWLFPSQSTSSSPSLCMGPQSVGSNSQGAWSGDEYIWIGTNPNPC